MWLAFNKCGMRELLFEMGQSSGCCEPPPPLHILTDQLSVKLCRTESVHSDYAHFNARILLHSCFGNLSMESLLEVH